MTQMKDKSSTEDECVSEHVLAPRGAHPTKTLLDKTKLLTNTEEIDQTQ